MKNNLIAESSKIMSGNEGLHDYACVSFSPCVALVLAGTEGRPGSCYSSGLRTRTLHSWNTLHSQTYNTPGGTRQTETDRESKTNILIKWCISENKNDSH